MVHPQIRSTLRRLAFPVVCVLIAVAMGGSLVRYGGPMVAAASRLSPGALALALVLCLAYRGINAAGWCLVLRSLHERVAVLPVVRVWLASEACRWLPGSLWAFGSRAVLASRRGLHAHTVAASLLLELLVTVLAWVVVAAMGGASLRLPSRLMPGAPPSAGLLVLAAGTGLAVGLVLFRSGKVRRMLAHGKALAQLRPDPIGLGKAFAFYVAMGVFNGATLLVIVRSIPGGASPPALAVIAANAVAWLAGFFALFAPGGLVVREACLTAMLAPWIPVEEAMAVALAWRLLQIVAEAVGFAVIALSGLPDSLGPVPAQVAAATPRGSDPGTPLASPPQPPAITGLACPRFESAKPAPVNELRPTGKRTDRPSAGDLPLSLDRPGAIC